MDTVRAYIDHNRAKLRDRIWLITPDLPAELSYQELKTRVDQIGLRLDALGLGKGAKVAFLSNNGAWATLIYLGVMANARVIVPLNAVRDRSK